MGGRKFLRKKRKYLEKKPLSLIVSIKLTSGISVLTTVSIPRELYITSPISTLSALKARLQTFILPQQWFFSLSNSSLALFKIHHSECQGRPIEVSASITVNKYLQWSVHIGERRISQADTPALASIPSTLGSISHVLHLFHLLDSSRRCIGNSDDQFMEIIRYRQATEEGITCTCRSLCMHTCTSHEQVQCHVY